MRELNNIALVSELFQNAGVCWQVTSEARLSAGTAGGMSGLNLCAVILTLDMGAMKVCNSLIILK